MREISVMLVDNNPLLAQLLSRFFHLEGRSRVTIANSRDEDVLTVAGLVDPEAVLIELANAGEQDLQTVRRLREILPDCLIVATFDTLEPRELVTAAGADSLVLKTDIDIKFLVSVHTWVRRNRQRARTMRPIQTSYRRAPQAN